MNRDRKPPWSEAEIAYLRSNYHLRSPKEVGEHLDRTPNAVRLAASKLKLPSLFHTGARSVQHDYFQEIDTPAKAYILGLLTADGCITTGTGQLTLALHTKDRDAVEFMRDELCPDTRITERMVRTSEMAYLHVQSPQITEDLARHGVVARKSLIIRWPETVPGFLEGSYLCGYFDGDGSLGLKPLFRWALTSGSRPFLEDVQERALHHTGVRIGGPYRDGRKLCWSIVKTGRLVQDLDAWLHADVQGFDRKRLPDSDNFGQTVK